MFTIASVACVLLCIPCFCIAAPVFPIVHELTQADGNIFKARQWGDEHCHGWETLDGYSILLDREKNNWCYAVLNDNGDLVSSDGIVGKSAPPLDVGPGVRGQCNASKGREQQQMGRRSTGYPLPIPTTGTNNLPVILINFKDTEPEYSVRDFDELLFGTENKSLKNYYEEVSYGALSLSPGPAGVMGWYQASENKVYYGKNDLTNGRDINAGQLVLEAVRAADAEVDFSAYDMNGDCRVDSVIIVFQGAGESATGIDSEIWPHASTLSEQDIGQYMTNDVTECGPVIIDRYTVQSELSIPADFTWQLLPTGQSGEGADTEKQPSVMQTVGGFAHEYGHVLGLPDFYDVDGSSRGIGSWGLMGSGNSNFVENIGDTPAHMTAWSKYILGWVQPTVVETTLVSEPVEAAAIAPDVYMIFSGKPFLDKYDYYDVVLFGGEDRDSFYGEYFLIENRQKIGFDAALPGEGLAIWHVDEKLTWGGLTNTIECYPPYDCEEYHYKLSLVQSDGLWELEKNENDGDNGDLHPGGANIISFIPNLYDGTQGTSIAVRSISAAASTMTADFIVFETGALVLPDLWLGAVMNSPVKGAVETKWKKVSENVTTSVMMTEESFAGLGSTIVPEDLVIRLEELKNRPYRDEKAFEYALETTIGTEQALAYRTVILKNAVRAVTARRILGYFYAESDAAGDGDKNNPQVFVKISMDNTGQLDVDFLNVSAFDIRVSSDYPYDGVTDEENRIGTSGRSLRHAYGSGGHSSYAPAGNVLFSEMPSDSAVGYTMSNDMTLGAVVQGNGNDPGNLVWYTKGHEYLSGGRAVIWGYFCASPYTLEWGTHEPDIFVKIFSDGNGGVDVYFFHVSASDLQVAVYSDYPHDGVYDQAGMTGVNNGYLHHEYDLSSSASLFAGRQYLKTDSYLVYGNGTISAGTDAVETLALDEKTIIQDFPNSWSKFAPPYHPYWIQYTEGASKGIVHGIIGKYRSGNYYKRVSAFAFAFLSRDELITIMYKNRISGGMGESGFCPYGAWDACDFQERTVWKRCVRGDADCDGIVDVEDLSDKLFSFEISQYAFGLTRGEAFLYWLDRCLRFGESCDYNADSIVNEQDLFLKFDRELPELLPWVSQCWWPAMLPEESPDPSEEPPDGAFMNTFDMTFELIPAGTFMMGSPSDEPGRDTDEILHEVTLSTPFYMQSTEVTEQQWKAIMGEYTGSYASSPEHPAQVTWEEAQAFVQALNEKGEGTYRLPTEAEWEYAAKTDAYTYEAFIETVDETGWTIMNAAGQLSDVAAKLPNAWGLYDMVGNVAEWCSDWYGEYPSGSVTDPVGPLSGKYKILRGGNYMQGILSCRPAYRGVDKPEWSNGAMGFRLVLSVAQ